MNGYESRIRINGRHPECQEPGPEGSRAVRPCCYLSCTAESHMGSGYCVQFRTIISLVEGVSNMLLLLPRKAQLLHLTCNAECDETLQCSEFSRLTTRAVSTQYSVCYGRCLERLRKICKKGSRLGLGSRSSRNEPSPNTCIVITKLGVHHLQLPFCTIQISSQCSVSFQPHLTGVLRILSTGHLLKGPPQSQYDVPNALCRTSALKYLLTSIDQSRARSGLSNTGHSIKINFRLSTVSDLQNGQRRPRPREGGACCKPNQVP